MILVTGASGHVGGRVAELLADRDVAFRVMTRTPGRAAVRGEVPVVQGDYRDPNSLQKVFDGVTVAFLVSGYAQPGVRARQHENAISEAVRAGVDHVVYLSFQGAAPDSAFPMSRDHFQTEQILRDRECSFTALRDNLYMDLLPEMFGPEGIVRGPAGEGQVAWVSREDVARTVVGVVTNPEPFEGIHNVTGPESLTLAETAERMSALVDRLLRYENETVEEARVWRRQLDVPEWEVETWIGSYEAIAAGELEESSDTVERITGRAPYRLEDYFSTYPETLDRIRAT